MITTVTLNPCVDRTVLVRGLSVGEHNRVEQTYQNISGKGINVSVVLGGLGEPTQCLFLKYAGGGSMAAAFLDGKGIPYRTLPVDGDMRMNLKVTDVATGVMTEINEPGNPVCPQTAEDFLVLLREALPDTDILVADGSVPPGIADDFYARLIDEARKYGVRTVLDADLALFGKGIKARPWLVKPNQGELSRHCGQPIESIDDALRLSRLLLDEGPEIVCLSLGAKGSLLVSQNGAWRCAGSDVPVLGVQGAGDSMVAGLCHAAMRKLPEREMLCYGVAAAQGSLIHPGTALCTAEDFEKMLHEVAATTLP